MNNFQFHIVRNLEPINCTRKKMRHCNFFLMAIYHFTRKRYKSWLKRNHFYFIFLLFICKKQEHFLLIQWFFSSYIFRYIEMLLAPQKYHSNSIPSHIFNCRNTKIDFSIMLSHSIIFKMKKQKNNIGKN